jgi:predicted ATP-grasp superfamily ATP-dependent carboligase
LGVTQQLVGESWLHAAPCHYCGSIGPLALDRHTLKHFQRLGTALAGLHLLGLFGVDCILRKGVPWPVEVNPRYTASAEVLEHVAATPLLALHRRVFDASAPQLPPASAPLPGILGKAILFARRALTFPANGPWTATLRRPGDLWEVPAFADIPHAGEHIEAGRPVLTFFARAGSVRDCLAQLRQSAADLDRHCLA